MAIELKEILGFSVEDAGKYNQSLPPPKDKGLDESYKEINHSHESNRNTNRVIIEAIHCYPFATRNFTRYMPEACRKSAQSWLDPYNRPVIMYHNDYDGEITGRVVDAEVKFSEKTGGDCLFLTATAPGWSTWDRIVDGIYKTTSIGVAATDVRCSICGAKLTDGKMCEHEKGYSYDGEVCYWDVYEFDPKEISYVITPSDPYSQIISIGYDECKKTENGVSVVDSRQRQYMITNKESKTQNNNKENNSDTMDITINESKYNELIQAKEALEVKKKVLANDKQELSKTINDLNKEKLVAQESIKTLNQTIADKDTEIDAIKQMKEALEKENEKLMEKVKESIVEKIVSIRESANLPKIDKLEERSLDMLMINLSDLKADIAARETIDARESVKPEGLTDEKEKPAENKEKKLEESEGKKAKSVIFDL